MKKIQENLSLSCYYCSGVIKRHCRNPQCPCGCYKLCQHEAIEDFTEVIEFFPKCKYKAYRLYGNVYLCKMHAKVHRDKLLEKLGGLIAFDWLVATMSLEHAGAKSLLENEMTEAATKMIKNLYILESDENLGN